MDAEEGPGGDVRGLLNRFLLVGSCKVNHGLIRNITKMDITDREMDVTEREMDVTERERESLHATNFVEPELVL